ncbi:MAG: hypothetical protein LR000_01020 [Candidatus Pacebacteria bacterium]|nr:hypothetical protein [Candidatus Paceibacterota bacterium]
MGDFLKNLKENKIAIAFLIVGLIVGGAIYLNQQKRDLSQKETSFSQNETQNEKCEINFLQAPDFVGRFCRVKGKIDHIYISQKGNIFLNFCKDYKTCPFYGVIFKDDAPKFEPEVYEGKIVTIEGLIKTYKGRAQIIINDSSQIEIE